MKIAWHYWCGTKSHPDRYIKYLLISLDSLIKKGKVDAKDIYVTIEPDLLQSVYGRALIKYKINLLEAPLYRNFSKQTGFCRLVQQHPDIEKIVQIDCDTIVTDEINKKIEGLQGSLNIDPSGHLFAFDTLLRRDGQRHKGQTLFSLSPERKTEQSAFKDLLKIAFPQANLDEWIERSKTEKLLVGCLYVMNVRALGPEFFELQKFLNLFFEDDEILLAFSRFCLGLTYDPINKNHVNRQDDANILFNAKTTEDFNKFKGIIHFPSNDSGIYDEMTRKADLIVENCPK